MQRQHAMSIETFDVIVLGGGNAGIAVTGPTRRAGLSVAMIELHDLGGTCPNRGCTPRMGSKPSVTRNASTSSGSPAPVTLTESSCQTPTS